MEEKFCSRHKDIEEMYRALKDNKKFFKRLFGSKWSYIFIPVIVLGILSWAAWVSEGTYAQNVEKKELATICKEIKEIKEENKLREERRDIQRESDKQEIKQDNKERDERERQTQQKMMDLLLDIQKQIKK